MAAYVFTDSLTLFIGIAWLNGYPFGRLILLGIVKCTKLPSTHPAAVHFIQISSRVYLGTIFLNFILLNIGAVYYYHGEKEVASLFNVTGCILLVGMVIFLSCYGFYFHKNIEKLIAAAAAVAEVEVEVDDDDDDDDQQRRRRSRRSRNRTNRYA